MNKRLLSGTALPALLLLFTITAQAQHACIAGLGMENQQIWWTGSSSAKYLMDFTGGAPVLSNAGIGQTESFESTAVYTSPGGSMLLYTDGDSIFNGQTNALIGTGVGGNPSATEAALIVPVPEGNPANDFYVFGNTASTAGPIRYAKVDISGNTIGAIVTLDGGLIFSESLGIVPHSNETDFWIMSVTNGTPTLNVYPVDSTGVSDTPVSSAIPSLPAGTTANRATVIYHPPTRQLAISFYSQNTTTGFIYTADFDETTGVASGFTQVVSGNLGYGVAFSPDASKMYYSIGNQGFNGTLTFRDLNTDTSTTIATGGWAMPRLAPDGKIYVVAFGSTTMGVVNSPDANLAAINWDATGIVLPAGSQAAYSLPNQTYAACEVNIVNPDTNARFLVSKTFSDGNSGQVEVMLSCNTGLPLQQSFMISPGNPVTFVVSGFADGAMSCEITETGSPGGYSVIYDNQVDGPSSISCTFSNITAGDYSCSVDNTLLPVSVVVTKEWFGSPGENGLATNASADYTCFNVLDAPDGNPIDVQGQLYFSGSLDTQTISGLFPDYQGGSYCRVVEKVIDAAVESDDSDCSAVPITPGSGNSCTITNTVFFEGVPTISQLGLAIMALLMFGIGLVGIRHHF